MTPNAEPGSLAEAILIGIERHELFKQASPRLLRHLNEQGTRASELLRRECLASVKGAQSKNREREEMRDAVLDTARELLELMGNSAETRRTLVSSIQDELGLKRPTDGRFIRKSLRDEGLLPHPH